MSAKLEIAKNNTFGDIVCPECGVNIMVPEGKRLVSGIGTCPWCKGEFIVKADREEEVYNGTGRG